MASFTATIIFLVLVLVSLSTSAFALGGHCVFGIDGSKPRGTINATDPTPLIRKTCAKTSHQALCLRTLSADEHAGEADIYGLVNVSIAAAVKKASDNGDQIETLLTQTTATTSADVKRCIRQCSKCWEDCYNLAEHAIKVLWCTGDIRKAIRCMTIAADRADVCKQSCVHAKGKGTDQVGDMNLVLKHLCTISAEIIQMLPESSMVLI